MVLDGAPQRSEGVLAGLAARGLKPVHMSIGAELLDLGRADVVVVVVDQAQARAQSERLEGMIEELARRQVSTLVWGLATPPKTPPDAHVQHLLPEASWSEVVGSVAMLSQYGPMVRQLDRELTRLQRAGEQMQRYFGEIDQEMRLAGRLQRDFLPRTLPSVGPLRFSAVYRPASWVSGDIYDVFRLDDSTVGVFMADAMGHGMSAALMTMFVRNGLVARRVSGERFEIVPPAAALSTLSEHLSAQQIPHQQFVTAVYATVNARTLCLEIARGGHPYAIRIDDEGRLSELTPEGGLLGIPDVPPECQTLVQPLGRGDRLIFYTDGIEDVFVRERDPETRRARFTDRLHDWVGMSADELTRALEEHLNGLEGSLNPPDDASMVVLEVAPDADG